MRRGRQDGFVFFLVLVIFAGIFGIYFAAQLQAGSNIREANRFASLEETRNALIGYAIRETTGGNGYRLGNFPNPDSLANGSYDGHSDTKCLSDSVNGLPPVTGSGVNKRCLGKIPWKDLGISFGTTESHDPLGLVPWIAVSANLAYWDSCLEKLNSEIVNWAYASHACPAAADTLPYPWLTVRDESGKVLSDRVAAVIILPGPQITTETRNQSRTPTSPGNPADYLDAIRLPLGCVACSVTYDNAGLNNEFIRVSPGARYPVDAENTALRGEPIPFNDRVDFITIDELLPHLERRVLADMSAALIATGKLMDPNFADPVLRDLKKWFPWAVPMGSLSNYAGIKSTPMRIAGYFPFAPAKTSPAPPFAVPEMETELTWSYTTAFATPTRDCKLVAGSWINVNQRIRTGTSPISAQWPAMCTWKGPQSLDCRGSVAPAIRTDSFTRYSSLGNCNAASGSIGSANYTRTRSMSFIIDADCSGTPTNTYFPADSTQTQRREWKCTSVKPGTTFDVAVVEDFGGVVNNLTLSRVSRDITVTTRYYPLMPVWFYGSDWYLSAFYVLAPAIAPTAGSTDCGGATSLRVASGTIDTALVMLAGSRLPNLPATPTQTRPSATLLNYFEGDNLTGFSNCIFGAIDDKPNASRNDQLFAVKP